MLFLFEFLFFLFSTIAAFIETKLPLFSVYKKYSGQSHPFRIFLFCIQTEGKVTCESMGGAGEKVDKILFQAN